MNSLEKMFPSLTLFSDLNWQAVTEEYQADYSDLSFPEYLQQKAIEGDCPPYLFELAFYEMALNEVKNSTDPFPSQTGIHLNPTALFLSLEFDVKRMLQEAEQGKIEVHERPHVLCLYKNGQHEILLRDVLEEELDLLQHLEDGPQENRNFISPSYQKHFQKLVQTGLILDL